MAQERSGYRSWFAAGGRWDFSVEEVNMIWGSWGCVVVGGWPAVQPWSSSLIQRVLMFLPKPRPGRLSRFEQWMIKTAFFLQKGPIWPRPAFMTFTPRINPHWSRQCCACNNPQLRSSIWIPAQREGNDGRSRGAAIWCFVAGIVWLNFPLGGNSLFWTVPPRWPLERSREPYWFVADTSDRPSR